MSASGPARLVQRCSPEKNAEFAQTSAADRLSGAASARESSRLRDTLSAFEPLPAPPDLWPRVAAARFRSARRGFQASSADLTLGVVAHRQRASLDEKTPHP